MAQEHTLKLKAVLDTSDIQAKLNRLNGQQSQAQQAGPSQGAPGGIAQGINNVLLRLNNTLTQLNQSIVRLTNSNTRQIARQTVNTPSSMPGIPMTGVGKLTDHVVENEVRTWVKQAIKTKNQAGWTAQLLDIDPASGIFNGGIRGSVAQRRKFQEIFGGMSWRELNDPRYKGYVDSFMNPGKGEFNPLYKRTMTRMLGGQVLGQFANLGQQHLEMTPEYSRYAPMVGAFQNVGQMAAYGSVLGAPGMFVGAGVGMLQSVYEDILNRRKQREQDVYDKIDAAGVKRKYTSAREAFGMDRSIYAATKNADIGSLEQIRQSLVIKQQNAEAGLRVLDRQQTIDPTVAADLQTTLASVISKIQAIDQTIEAIKKHKEEEARLSEKINKGISDSRLAMSRYDEARLNGRFFSENVDDYRQNAELYGSTARASKAEYLRLLQLAESETDNEKKQPILRDAEDAKSSWQFNLGQSDSFQQGYISKLQEILSRLVAPDMSPVTSLAAIGRDAGASDNMYRQQRFWDETLNLQREIRDAIDKGVATYD